MVAKGDGQTSFCDDITYDTPTDTPTRSYLGTYLSPSGPAIFSEKDLEAACRLVVLEGMWAIF